MKRIEFVSFIVSQAVAKDQAATIGDVKIKPTLYRLEELKVGQVKIIKNIPESKIRVMAKRIRAAGRRAIHGGKKFSVRTSCWQITIVRLK